MNDSEEVSYTLSHRPTGFINWVKSIFGFGVTHWYVTNQRVVEHQRVGGGFRVQDIPLEKVTSVEYGRKMSLPVLILGILIGLLGLAALVPGESGVAALFLVLGGVLVAYAFSRKKQVLAVHGSGGVNLVLNISKGDNVDDVLWYVNTERQRSNVSAGD